MFLDASAIIAIISEEPGANRLLRKMEAAEKLYFSPSSAFEAIVGIARRKSVAENGDQLPTPPALIERCQMIVLGFLAELKAVEVPLDTRIRELAVRAAQDYGRYVGHPAKLNFGDCFSYACAKAYRVPLLYKGNDFSQTDLA
ncbi:MULTISPECIES: type II toxin-antitoxin system VapC family toxin [unclassified Mesorhizobium]|uniref:type II toxin-antitoxin system VapC family toxin n=1 Tax=unclassified Mesorhizobium TaxID=325217 RepID=UPI0007FF290F|nr:MULTISPECIES: type II toxin-antitoxin system VapC family toxin [unclassified Mesorhizobium]MDG4854746.1 type II toxin-antitoxin system VapC family toxin [Mesorhizobium sp. WSM4982]MDG4914136.1 type II toxin-antitoxin system VapC family toxin [Mesorhizobium sp. WSM4983]OBQ82049.1 twitching motility protein PilT [Mesorhizobium sp. WSM3873]OBQ96368.1 twitching motility protein PilT [Mesorhizobium sp. AA23]RUW00938.1 type II toxin-antitoxin system VapC family toxin [Mesorhizobium sp. M1A.F.Ca.I